MTVIKYITPLSHYIIFVTIIYDIIKDLKNLKSILRISNKLSYKILKNIYSYLFLYFILVRSQFILLLDFNDNYTLD